MPHTHRALDGRMRLLEGRDTRLWAKQHTVMEDSMSKGLFHQIIKPMLLFFHTYLKKTLLHFLVNLLTMEPKGY